MIFNYYTTVELFKNINENNHLYFTLISDFYYNNFRIKKANITDNILHSKHIYLETIKIKKNNIIINNTNLINLKEIAAESGCRCYGIVDLKKLDLVKFDFFYDLNILYGKCNINHMKKLKVLYANNFSDTYINIYNEDIKNLDLYELYIHNLEYLSCIKCTKNLRILECSLSGVTHNIDAPNLVKLKTSSENDISHLTNLKELHSMNNKCSNINNLKLLAFKGQFITGIENMTSLKKIELSWIESGYEDCLKNLDLLVLSIQFNKYISINNLKNLKCLYITHNRTITENDLSGLNLIKLYMGSSYIINDLNYLKNLKILSAYSTNLKNNGIKNINPIILDITHCKVHKINHMTRLKKLDVTNNSSITDDDIKNINPIILSAQYTNISNITHMNKLSMLYYNSSKIKPETIKNTNITIIDNFVYLP